MSTKSHAEVEEPVAEEPVAEEVKPAPVEKAHIDPLASFKWGDNTYDLTKYDEVRYFQIGGVTECWLASLGQCEEQVPVESIDEARVLEAQFVELRGRTHFGPTDMGVHSMDFDRSK